jgi:hypothetical protein
VAPYLLPTTEEEPGTSPQGRWPVGSAWGAWDGLPGRVSQKQTSGTRFESSGWTEGVLPGTANGAGDGPAWLWGALKGR